MSNRFVASIPLGLAGAAIGWLSGLAASPVVATILSSLMALLAAAASAQAGIRIADAEVEAEAKPAEDVAEGDRRQQGEKLATMSPRLLALSLYPVVALVLGIGLGATFGVWVRTRDWLSPSPRELVERWSNLGLDKATIARHFLHRLEPIGHGAEEKAEEKPDKPGGGGAKSAGPAGSTHASVMWSGGKIDTCKLLLHEMDSYDLATLRGKLNQVGTPFPGAIGDAINDEVALRGAIRVICEAAAP